jgi:endonuclease/exonuclease/phosphatase family metal-dependent hydrolase
MKIKLTLLALASCLSLLGDVNHSIIPALDQLIIKDLKGKINEAQILDFVNLPADAERLRIVSFNMLFNLYDVNLEPEDRWENRKNRVAEYIQWAHPDLIGTQELQSDQLDDLLSTIGTEYDFYGIGAADGLREGDIPAIFYRKNRLELIKGETFYFSETPEQISNNPFGGKNTFTFCHFRDRSSGQEFLALNTHLAFNNMERRYYEACKLRDFLLAKRFQLPVVITGDFNTFPFRQELDLPFYDGDKVIHMIEEGLVIDSSKRPIFGHFGPISSTNFSNETKKPFCSVGDPGVILDHIFVSDKIEVLAHGIDGAKVDGHFPSDHLPVIIDILFK